MAYIQLLEEERPPEGRCVTIHTSVKAYFLRAETDRGPTMVSKGSRGQDKAKDDEQEKSMVDEACTEISRR